MRKQILFLLSLVLVLESLALGVSAQEVPDLQAGGTITVTLNAKGEAANTGSLTFFHVAEITEENGSYRYVLTEEFEDSGLSLKDPNSPGLAQALAHYAAVHQIPGKTQRIRSGKVVFHVAPGELGLYLVVQSEACRGYEKINPFVIGVPMTEDGVYQYDVDAAPKMGDLIPNPTEPTFPPIPTEPTWPTIPTEPTVPTEPTIPTGPTVPTEPTAPTEPTIPTGPTVPTGPTIPTEPTGPTTPTEPAVPSEPTVPGESTVPTKPSVPSTPTESTEPGLPQTGQLNWPVPVLAVAGMLLFGMGWCLYMGSKEK